MKKKLVFIFIIIVLILQGYSIYHNLHKKVEMPPTIMKYPKEIEDKILTDITRTPESHNYLLLSDLLKSKQWNIIDPPIDYQGWKYLESKNDEWKIYKINNELKVTNERFNMYDKYDYRKLHIKEGLFLSVFEGEWGGALYFYPDGDKDKKYKINDGYTWDIINNGEEIYTVEAVPFNENAKGKLLKLEKHFGKWKAKEVLKLDDVPYCLTSIDKKTMYVATNKKLLKVVDNKIVEVVVDNAFWQGLCPNTIECQDECLYIGMRAGVAKVNLNDKTIEFITPYNQ